MIKLTKEPPYGMGETACLINAVIDTLELNVDKLSSIELGKISNTVSQMYSMKSINFTPDHSVGKLWIATVEYVEKMSLDSNIVDTILNKANLNYNYLTQNKSLN
ncbi:MAG: hypothetical protein JXR39_11465 [Marinilabiliaceae bacterium]|nr:hypothetical protein [Marinilabiliaceae bacterium]